MQKSTLDKDNSIQFVWRSRTCSANDWEHVYNKDKGDVYAILQMDYEGKRLQEVTFAYPSVGPSLDLPVSNYDDLKKIEEYCKSRNIWPRPFENKN